MSRSKLVLNIVALLFSFGVFGGSGEWSKRVQLNELASGDQFSLYDPVHLQTDVMQKELYEGFVYLEYNREQQSDLSQSVDWQLHVQYFLASNPSDIRTLTIQYLSGEYIYTDYEKHEILTADRGYEVQIKSVYGEYRQGSGGWNSVNYPQLSPYFPDDIDFRIELRSTRWFNLDLSSTTDDRMLLNFNPTDYRLNWNYVQGAEEYDVEWSFIESESNEHGELTDILLSGGVLTEAAYQKAFELQEPVRVRVWGTHYELDKIYTQGILCFRVRPVSKWISSGAVETQTKTGDWFYFNSLTLPAGGVTISDLVYHEIGSSEAFSPEKNWLYGVAYAEQGKSVSSLTYYDGSNRGRQSHTYNTSDQVTLVSESKFDYEGRQVVSIIPAPVKGKVWNYLMDFNLANNPNGLTPAFDEEDFDIANPVPLLSTSLEESGAAQYFSSNNQFEDDLFRAAIPDAGGYVYSQTVYRNDGTGRIESVGGIGETFKANGDHAVKTMYGSVIPFEVQRLFGQNVGRIDETLPNNEKILKGYRKNMVRDANGQLSVTYYDQRGHVIATGLAGNAPSNLIGLEGSDDVVGVEDALIPNTSTDLDAHIYVANYTFPNPLQNNPVTLKYDLTSATVFIGQDNLLIAGQYVPISSICQSCKYKLRIEITDQQGNHLASSPYEQLINPTLTCDNSGTMTNVESLEITTVFPEIEDYRITKTLSLDLESMSASIDEYLLNSSVMNQNAFVNNYIAQLDYSDCYSSCDDYCVYNAEYLWDQEHGIGSFDQLSTIAQEELIEACITLGCDPNEINEDFGSSASTPGTINPYSVACSSLEDKLESQISPGGVFYDDLNSILWEELETGVFTSSSITVEIPAESGNQFSLSDLQNPDLFNSDVLDYLKPFHREHCHLAFCSDWATSINYSNSLLTQIQGGTWNSSNVLLQQPYQNDPFIGLAFNTISGNGNQLQLKVDSYLDNHHSELTTNGCSNVPTTGNLFAYVETQMNCLEQINIANNVILPADYYLLLKKQTFMGLYGNIKEELIRDYKLVEEGCPYYYDDNRVFFGPMTTEQMEEEILQSLAGLYTETNCEERSLQNTAMWLEMIPQSCLEALTPAYYDPSYTATDLQANLHSDHLEQLLYTYGMVTCATNTYGWFYNPDPDETGTPDGETQYDAIITMLNSSCGITGMLPFETTNPETIGLDMTTQQIPSCFMAVLEELNNQFIILPNQTSPYQFTTTATAENCMLSAGNMGFVINSQGDYTYDITLQIGSCAHKLYFADNLPGRILSLSNPVKHAFYLLPGINILATNVVTFDAMLTTGSVVTGAMISSSAAGCLDFGTFDDFILSDIGDFTPPMDFEQFCIEANLEQGTIDAENYFETLKQEVKDNFMAETMQCMQSPMNETFTISYNLKEYQYTLYYYDLAGNLVQTVPPQGVDILTQVEVNNGQNPDHKMETRYQYNGLNSLIGQYTPDGGKTTFYLDKLYRVRYSQNARQVLENKASYSNYDELGRVVEAGEVVLNQGTTQTEIYLQNLADGTTSSTTLRRLDYTKTTYEDVYPNDPSIASIFNDGEQLNLRNAIGAIEHHQADYNGDGTMIPGSEIITVSSYSYDPHKNVKQIVNTNYALQTDYATQKHKTVEYEYDLISGNVNKVHYQKGERDEFNHMYHYDANNRLIRAFTSPNEDVWEMDAKYFYYLHGALARRELGENKVQGTDYAYNLQGWLKGVNSTTLDQNRDLGKDGVSDPGTGNGHIGDNQFFGVDAFGFNLNYFAGDYTPIGTYTQQTLPFATTDDLRTVNDNLSLYPNNNFGNLYNGNITHMVTAIRNLNENVIPILGNNYRYDQLQRIKGMDVYTTSTIEANNSFSGIVAHTSGTSAYEEMYSYDKNGNILSLQRNGSGVNATGTLAMDDFNYKYYDDNSVTAGINANPVNGNRLAQVWDNITDNVTTPNYTTDIESGQAPNNYQYDASGQLIKDLQEGIDKIEWTVTGKVKRITFVPSTGKHGLLFVYDPMDMRVAKIVYNNAEHTEYSATYYVHDAQGNPMSTYTTQNFNPANGDDIKDKLYLSERYIYGSSRLGLEQVDKLMAFKQSDLTELDLGNPVVINSFTGPAGTWFKSDNTHGNFTNYVVFTPGDYNTDGKSDLKISHDNSSTTFGAHVWSQLDAGKSATLEWDMLTSTSKIIVLYALNDAGTILTETWCNNAGHYSTTINVPTNSTGRTRFKFYTINQSTALDYTVANFKVTGATNPWGKELAPALPVEQEELIVGDKRYELSNHLGNVLATVSDRKVPLVIGSETVYSADVVSYSDYSPFGVQLDNRHGEEPNGDYRYGMNGMEKDDEIKGAGNSYTTEFRQFDPRIGRWLSIDPILKYHESPYASFSNNPICFADPTGADTFIIAMTGELVDRKFDNTTCNKLMMSICGELYQLESNDNSPYQDENGEWVDDFVRLKKMNIGDQVLNFITEENTNFILYGSWVGVQEDPHYYLSQHYNDYLDFGSILTSAETDSKLTDKQMDSRGGFFFFGDNADFVSRLLREGQYEDEYPSTKIYNLMDAGNFLFGQAAYRIGAEYEVVRFATEMRNFPMSDSWEDQDAIRDGFLYRVTTEDVIVHEIYQGLRANMFFDDETGIEYAYWPEQPWPGMFISNPGGVLFRDHNKE